MDWSVILEAGKAFGVAGVILFALGIGGWRIFQRLMPKFEQFFDDHHVLVVSLRDALTHFGIRLTSMDERAALHGEKLDGLTEIVERIDRHISAKP